MHKKNESKIVIMDFSGIYRKQCFWGNRPVRWVEAADIRGTNCYCDAEAFAELCRRIEKFKPEGIHFIDSGNYHYMSRIWLGKIQKPFRLLMFDNHTDMQPPAFGGQLSCGGWLADALSELPNLRAAVLVGPDQEAYAAAEEGLKSKVRFLSRETLAAMNLEKAKRFFKEIPGDLPLYISVDKDILCPQDACTAWSQGDMRFPFLAECIRAVMENTISAGQDFLGMDVCGECEENQEGRENELANRKLLDMFEDIFGECGEARQMSGNSRREV